MTTCASTTNSTKSFQNIQMRKALVKRIQDCDEVIAGGKTNRKRKDSAQHSNCKKQRLTYLPHTPYNPITHTSHIPPECVHPLVWVLHFLSKTLNIRRMVGFIPFSRTSSEELAYAFPAYFTALKTLNCAL